ncbi:hypothetical protein B7494_g333 [Chlorociboria aeruginascens]|nr:hypothetical protein B7494_g333 [Chlorociboria aeruginascens]
MARLYDDSGLIVAEDRERYRVNGYCPIHIDQVINQRYEIWHKLGYGGQATVWLAHDTQTNQNVALKIGCGTPTCLTTPSKERTWLNSIRNLPQFSDFDFVPEVLDTFNCKSGNGWHRCLVTTLVGPSIDAWSKRGKRLPQLDAKNAALKVARGVAFLHRHRICHGDLTPKNILLEAPAIRGWTKETIYQNLGAPYRDPVVRLDRQIDKRQFERRTAPQYIVEAAGLETLSIDDLSGNIKIIDFGVSFYANRPPPKLQTPPAFLSPEAMFEPASGGITTDNWALMMVIFMIRSGHHLFGEGTYEKLEAIQQIIKIIGPLPERWKAMGFDEHTSELITRPGSPTFWSYMWRDEGPGNLAQLTTQVIAEREGSNLSENSVSDRLPNGNNLSNVEWRNPPSSFILGLRTETLQQIEARDNRKRLATKISTREAIALYDLMSKVLIYDRQLRWTSDRIIQHPWFQTTHPYSGA